MDLTTNDARLALAKKWAAGLDPELVCAVIEQESSWDPFAVRFEPAFETRYIHPALPGAPSTMELTRAMSFGLMQIMGQTAMELGWRGYYLTNLCDPDIGVDYGCRKLRKCFAAVGEGNTERALLVYNGGGNSFYGKQVLARVGHYQPPAISVV